MTAEDTQNQALETWHLALNHAPTNIVANMAEKNIFSELTILKPCTTDQLTFSASAAGKIQHAAQTRRTIQIKSPWTDG